MRSLIYHRRLQDERTPPVKTAHRHTTVLLKERKCNFLQNPLLALISSSERWIFLIYLNTSSYNSLLTYTLFINVWIKRTQHLSDTATVMIKCELIRAGPIGASCARESSITCLCFTLIIAISDNRTEDLCLSPSQTERHTNSWRLFPPPLYLSLHRVYVREDGSNGYIQVLV